MLIGGANDFQEFAKGYYNIKSTLNSNDMKLIAKENEVTKQEMDKEVQAYKDLSHPIHVCVTSASRDVSYRLIRSLVNGECFGMDTEISLKLLDSEEAKNSLEGVQMEAFDLAAPLLRKISTHTDPEIAFEDASAIILLDDIEKNEEESEKEWLVRIHEHYCNYAELIDKVAKPDVKILVSGKGPINFIIYMMQEKLSNVPAKNIVGVARLVENHAKAIIANRLNVNSAGVVDLTVWGNVNGTTAIDISKVSHIRTHTHNWKSLEKCKK